MSFCECGYSGIFCVAINRTMNHLSLTVGEVVGEGVEDVGFDVGFPVGCRVVAKKYKVEVSKLRHAFIYGRYLVVT